MVPARTTTTLLKFPDERIISFARLNSVSVAWQLRQTTTGITTVGTVTTRRPLARSLLLLLTTHHHHHSKLTWTEPARCWQLALELPPNVPRTYAARVEHGKVALYPPSPH